MSQLDILLRRVQELESTVAENNATIAALDSAIAEKHAALVEKQAAVAEHQAAIKEREDEISRLERYVAALERLVANKSEKRPRAEAIAKGQQFLAGIFESALRGTEQTKEVATGSLPDTPKKKRRKRGRRATFPDDVPVFRSTFELPEDQRVCACGSELTPMGEEVSRELERLEFTIIHEIARTKYCCRGCQEGVTVARGPIRVIDKGILGVGFLAHVLSERFQNHMPYYRQEKRYGSEGLKVSRSVLCTSAKRCADLLMPIVDQLKKEVLDADIVHTDDTPVKMQQQDAPGTKTARLWIYRDLDGSSFFDFTPSRSRDGPAKILQDFKGYLVADAYPSYDKMFHPEGATEVACWAHTRRKFIDAEKTEPQFAKEAIEKIAALYALEKSMREREATPSERRALRNEHAKPRLQALRAWMAATRTQVLDKSPLARAIDYTLANWEALCRYTTDGRLPIDNNAAERALRGVAVGRKNWLFMGNDGGGKTAAAMFSLVESCKAAGVNAREYFRDVLLRISTCSDVTKLTPHAWKEHFLDDVERRRQEALKMLMPK